MQQQTHEVLTNGLGSFAQVSPDYELAPVGLASMRQQAQRLADHGRNGDIYVVHAAEGETVIPVEVLDANPMVKELLFEQMRDMGLDPGRYMVGNDLNSLNPETGMPEFFFKSIFKGVGKVIKKVVKVVKKVAPIVLPLAASAFGIPFLGPAFGAGTFGASFVGSGIGSLLGGDPLPTALKKAFIGGGLASLTGLAKGAFSSTGTALGGLEGSFTGSTPVFGAPGTASAGQQIGVNVAASPGGAKSIFGASEASRAGGEASKAQLAEFGKGNLFKGAFGGTFGETGQGTPGYLATGTPTEVGNLTNTSGLGFDAETAETMTVPRLQKASSFAQPSSSASAGSKTQDGFFDKVGDYMFRGGDTKAAIDARMDAAGQRYLKSTLEGVRTPAAYEAARNAAGPGIVAKYLPSAALGLGAMYLGGGFETGETGESQEEREAYEKRFNQFKYGTGLNQVYNNNKDNFGVKLYSEGFQPPDFDTSGRPIMRAAAGGATFDPLNYTGAPLNREYTPPIQYQDSRNTFNPNFDPSHAPVPTYLDFQSSYAPLDVDPYYQSGYAPTASDPNAAPKDLDEITDETATSGIASIAEPVKPLFFFDEASDNAEDQAEGFSGQDADPGGMTMAGLSQGWDSDPKTDIQIPGIYEAPWDPSLSVTQKDIDAYNAAKSNMAFSDPQTQATMDIGYDATMDSTAGGPTSGTSTGADQGFGFDAETGEGGAGAGSGPSGGGGPGQGGAAAADGMDGTEDDNEDDTSEGGGGDGDPGGEGGGEDGSEGEGWADGGYTGEDYRPRAQMLVEGPGTERSDDIPAMLSDGEFVLNARSVRGADPTGQGNRYLGAQNLYRMMRDFEMRA